MVAGRKSGSEKTEIVSREGAVLDGNNGLVDGFLGGRVKNKARKKNLIGLRKMEEQK